MDAQLQMHRDGRDSQSMARMENSHLPESDGR